MISVRDPYDTIKKNSDDEEAESNVSKKIS